MSRRYYPLVLVSALLCMGTDAQAQQYPVMEKLAQKVVQKYQQSSCEQLWEQKGKAKPEREQEIIQLLRNDPQMRTAFINKVAAPIANKMFDCGMIP